jgi:hypothetical protein
LKTSSGGKFVLTIRLEARRNPDSYALRKRKVSSDQPAIPVTIAFETHWISRTDSKMRNLFALFLRFLICPYDEWNGRKSTVCGINNQCPLLKTVKKRMIPDRVSSLLAQTLLQRPFGRPAENPGEMRRPSHEIDVSYPNYELSTGSIGGFRTLDQVSAGKGQRKSRKTRREVHEVH